MPILNARKRCRGFVIHTALLCVFVFAPLHAHAATFSVNSLLASAHQAASGFWCGTLSPVTTFFGFCDEAEEEVVTSPPQNPPSTPTGVATAEASEPQPTEPAPPPPAAAPQPATSTPEPITTTTETPTYVTNQYITNPTTIIRETIERGGGGSSVDTSNFVTRSLFDAQVDATHNSLSDSVSGISDNLSEELATDLLTVTGNGTLSGTLGVTGALTTSAYLSAPYLNTSDTNATSTLRGALSVGTSTSQAALTLDGALYLASIAPAQTASRLYNQNGSLYWAGNIVAGASVGTWDAAGGDVYRLTGNVGIGTSSPSARLHIDGGDVQFNDSSNNPGFFFDESSGRVGFGMANPSYDLDLGAIGATLNIGAVGAGSPAIYLRGKEILSYYTGSGGARFPDSVVFGAPNNIDSTYRLQINGANGVNGIIARNSGTYNVLRVDGGAANIDNQGNAQFIGSVGIGTTTPTSKLSIQTTGTTDILNLFETDGEEVFTVLENGNVGIGTTGPQNKLEISETNSGNDSVLLRLTNKSGGAGTQASINFQLSATNGFTTGKVSNYYNSASDRGLSFSTYGSSLTEKLRITGAGNVGIGTTNPSSRLQVENASNQTAYGSANVSNQGLTLINSQNSSFRPFGVQFGHVTDKTFGGIYGVGGVTHTNTTGDIAIALRGEPSDSTFTERLRITRTGNVGIGTTEPGAVLDVVGLTGGRFSNLSGLTYSTLDVQERGRPALEVVNRNAAQYRAGLHIYEDGSDSGTYISSHQVGAGSWSAGAFGDNVVHTGEFYPLETSASAIVQNSGNVQFYYGTGLATGSAATLSESVRITNTGNVGIGTTSPVSKLSVTGTMSVDGLTGNTGAGSLCLTTSNEVVYNSGSDNCLSSTRETKHDITTLDVTALDMVSALESMSFKYNQGDGRTRYGFIAEDVADIDALLATYDAEGNISGIDDRSMIAVVVKAMQEMWAKVQEYFARTEKLEKEVETLKTRLEALESGNSGDSSGEAQPETESSEEEESEVTEEEETAGERSEPATDTTSSTNETASSTEAASEDESEPTATTTTETDTEAESEQAEETEEETTDADASDESQSDSSSNETEETTEDPEVDEPEEEVVEEETEPEPAPEEGAEG